MKIVWTELALSDLNSAHEYIAQERPVAAIRVVEKIEKSLEAIRRYPDLGRPGRISGTREIVVPDTPFIIPYRIRAKRLEILAIIHSSRRWPDQL